MKSAHRSGFGPPAPRDSPKRAECLGLSLNRAPGQGVWVEAPGEAGQSHQELWVP